MPPPSTQLFAEHLPTEWIQHLLTLSAHATICRLNLSADGEAGISLLARSAVTQERQRVGALVEWLFRQTAQTWGAERYLKDDWHGLQLFAIDGAQFRTPMNLSCVNIMALPTHPLSGRAPTRSCVWWR